MTIFKKAILFFLVVLGGAGVANLLAEAGTPSLLAIAIGGGAIGATVGLFVREGHSV